MKIIEVKIDERQYKIGAIINDSEKLISVPFVVCDRNLERIDAKSYNSVSEAMECADNKFMELMK